MWLAALSSDLAVLGCGHMVYWRNPLGLKKKKRKKKEVLMKHIEYGDVLVECEQLAGESVNVCGTAEVSDEQAGK